MPPYSGKLSLHSRPLAVSAAGAVGVLLVHALLVLPFVLTLSLPTPRRPNTTGVGASAFVPAVAPDMTVVFIDDPPPPVENAAPLKQSILASRGIPPPDLPLVVWSPDPSPAAANLRTADSNDTQKDTVAAEAAEHARLYGRYLGQVQARIERAWLRPRTGIGAPRFSCRVRIRQDRQGDVIGIDLDHCNGTEAWRQSVLSAIRTASPLSAPPDASVYADVLWLGFASEAFEQGGSTQGFEPDSPQTAMAADRTRALESFDQFVTGAGGKPRRRGEDDTKVLHLTIIGSPASSSPPGAARSDPPQPALPESQAEPTPQ